MEKGFQVKPIGFVRSGRGFSRVSILPEYGEGLDGVETFTHIILLCWMHMARRDVLKVRPRPRPGVLCGVFATRSPSRPNPIGVYVAKLLERRELDLYISSIDAYDGTPVLDIKPYIAGIDSVPDAGLGLFDEKTRYKQAGEGI